jgi:hypothetical protein
MTVKTPLYRPGARAFPTVTPPATVKLSNPPFIVPVTITGWLSAPPPAIPTIWPLLDPGATGARVCTIMVSLPPSRVTSTVAGTATLVLWPPLTRMLALKPPGAYRLWDGEAEVLDDSDAHRRVQRD